MKSVRSCCLRILALISSLLGFNTTFGQTEFSLYRLNKTLPQANMLNPAFASNFRLVIGLPVISSIQVSADLDGISFVNVFNSTGASMSLDTTSIYSKLKEVNRVRLNQSMQLFYLGATIGKSYVSVGLHQVSHLRMNYPGDLVGWAIRGPGHSQYVGSPLDVGSLYVNALAYNKTSISLGRSFGDRLRLGVRFNFLRGIAMLETAKLSGQLIAGIDSVTVQTGQIQVNTAGLDFFAGKDRKLNDYAKYLFNNGNKGTAWDLGACYQITKRLSVSTAFNDLGFINWQDYTRSYHHKPVTYTYRGMDYLDFIDRSGEINVDGELDSLRSLFKPTETTGRKYTSHLIGRVYTGISYHVRGMSNVSALMYFDLVRGSRNPAFSLGYATQVGKRFNATIGVTLQQRKIDNIGAGLALRLSNFQIFATSDRTQSILYPARATRADIHTGMNLVFGELEDDIPGLDKQYKSSMSNGLAARKKKAANMFRKQSKNKIAEGEVVAPSVMQPKTRTRTRQTLATSQSATNKQAGERRESTKQGRSRDQVSHIVVVGSFISQDKAEHYSRELRQRGYTNKLGYDSEKSRYHIYVFRSRDLDEARHMRNKYRKNGEFRFAGSWVLSVADGRFQ